MNDDCTASLSGDSRQGIVTGAPRVRAQRPTSRGFLRRQGLDRPADKGHGRNRATRPRPMTNRVKSGAAARRSIDGRPSPKHVGGGTTGNRNTAAGYRQFLGLLGILTALGCFNDTAAGLAALSLTRGGFRKAVGECEGCAVRLNLDFSNTLFIRPYISSLECTNHSAPHVCRR